MGGGEKPPGDGEGGGLASWGGVSPPGPPPGIPAKLFTVCTDPPPRTKIKALHAPPPPPRRDPPSRRYKATLGGGGQARPDPPYPPQPPKFFLGGQIPHETPQHTPPSTIAHTPPPPGRAPPQMKGDTSPNATVQCSEMGDPPKKKLFGGLPPPSLSHTPPRSKRTLGGAPCYCFTSIGDLGGGDTPPHYGLDPHPAQTDPSGFGGVVFERPPRLRGLPPPEGWGQSGGGVTPGGSLCKKGERAEDFGGGCAPQIRGAPPCLPPLQASSSPSPQIAPPRGPSSLWINGFWGTDLGGDPCWPPRAPQFIFWGGVSVPIPFFLPWGGRGGILSLFLSFQVF